MPNEELPKLIHLTLTEKEFMFLITSGTLIGAIAMNHIPQVIKSRAITVRKVNELGFDNVLELLARMAKLGTAHFGTEEW